MRGANGALLIIVGLLVLWIVLSNKTPCIGGFIDCMSKSNPQPTTIKAAT